MAGLTANGLEIKRFPEVLADTEAAERANIDPNINTRDDELLGQLNNIFSAGVAEVWEACAAVYDAFNIAKAEGKNLDDLAALRGVSRITASKTSGTQEFSGTDGTIIPTGSVITNPITGDRFLTDVAVTLTSSSCYNVTYSVRSLLNNTQYDLEVNDSVYSYTSDASATNLEILNGLKAQIDADTAATFTATVVNETLVLQTTDTVLNASSITYLGVDTVTVRSTISADVVGDVVAPAGAVTSIITNVVGWNSTSNPNQLVVGRLEETDEELRVRIPQVTSSGSTGTIPSIEGALLANVDGITTVSVIENTTAVTDGDGRPPHSYETIVVGGDNNDVAQEIWRTKPAGISLFGNTNVIINDSNGNLRSIDFTRPVAINLACRVQYTKYSEEQFPSDGDTTILNTVLADINALGIDEDVIPSRLFGPIYSSVSGIDSLTVEVQTITNPGDVPVPGNWQTARLAINPDEFANITNVDITVSEV